MEKIARGHVGERLIQHKAKASAALCLRPTCGGALTGLKHLWLTNCLFWLLLEIQKIGYARDQQCCIFHMQCCIFQRVLYGKNSTVIHLMFAHANALTNAYNFMMNYLNQLLYKVLII